MKHLLHLPGLDIYLSPFLPIPETVKVCDIETREEVSLLTGKMIHCIDNNGKIFVSKEAIEQLKKQKNNPRKP